MTQITAEKFREATGRDPEQDDLERCNCQLAGKVGHYMCGWSEQENKPMFECNPLGPAFGAWGAQVN